MFLMELESREKFAFLKIANYLAKLDGIFAKNEKEIIKEYCLEMGIDNIYFENEKFDLSDTLAIFKSRKSQKILLLELMILVHADNEFQFIEKELIQKISSFFQIEDDEVKQTSSWGKSISELRNEALEFIRSS
ncbi:MAG: TerB family tellurite resistance protein [Sulfurospirillaceae bacterium]|nr:TerB family tellurite resistance protein [Sulfurospirillaceae bacterium]